MMSTTQIGKNGTSWPFFVEINKISTCRQMNISKIAQIGRLDALAPCKRDASFQRRQTLQLNLYISLLLANRGNGYRCVLMYTYDHTRTHVYLWTLQQKSTRHKSKQIFLTLYRCKIV